jgi:hypothetical protein
MIDMLLTLKKIDLRFVMINLLTSELYIKFWALVNYNTNFINFEKSHT